MQSVLLKLIVTWQLVVLTVVSSAKLGHGRHSVAAADAKKWRTLTGNPTTIIGHRGEKVLMPEHTVGSYEVACIEGADYVEPDLVLTNDLELVCFHDLTLKAGTNIEEIEDPAIQSLKKNFTGMIGNVNVTFVDDWVIPDLTLAQIKMLKVVQKNIGVRPQYFNSLFEIPTFQEYLDVVHKMSHKMKVPIGIIPELKHPDLINDYLNLTDFFIENKALEVLKAYGYPLKSTDQGHCQTREKEDIQCGHVVLQSFDKRSLEYLKEKTDIELMMLVDDDVTLLTLDSLDHISQFATYYSVWKEILYSGIEPVLKEKGIEYDPMVIEQQGGFIPKATFTNEVHSRGMLMGIYTLYDSREPSYMGCAVECRLPENKTFELNYYFELGVDAMFVENIKEATDLRTQYAHSLTGQAGLATRPNFLGLVTSVLFFVGYNVA